MSSEEPSLINEDIPTLTICLDEVLPIFEQIEMNSRISARKLEKKADFEFIIDQQRLLN